MPHVSLPSRPRSLLDKLRALLRSDVGSQIVAVNRVMAVIEFSLDGRILWANDNFLRTMGYRLDEVRGQHHRMFVPPEQRDSEEYRQFWQRLASGTFEAGRFKRIGNGGREVWINASYNPILDASSRPYKVVKYATDITDSVLRAAEDASRIAAIDKAVAVIEFDLRGNILDANENFLRTMGYQRGEIIGKHHRIFVEPRERDSSAYRQFWEKLGRGEHDAGRYRRLAKSGREVWLNAT